MIVKFKKAIFFEKRKASASPCVSGSSTVGDWSLMVNLDRVTPNVEKSGDGRRKIGQHSTVTRPDMNQARIVFSVIPLVFRNSNEGLRLGPPCYGRLKGRLRSSGLFSRGLIRGNCPESEARRKIG